ncbi:MAG: hypothetical protein ABFS24_15155 [Pseudomonadota bacterium]
MTTDSGGLLAGVQQNEEVGRPVLAPAAAVLETPGRRVWGLVEVRALAVTTTLWPRVPWK